MEEYDFLLLLLLSLNHCNWFPFCLGSVYATA